MYFVLSYFRVRFCLDGCMTWSCLVWVNNFSGIILIFYDWLTFNIMFTFEPNSCFRWFLYLMLCCTLRICNFGWFSWRLWLKTLIQFGLIRIFSFRLEMKCRFVMPLRSAGYLVNCKSSLHILPWWLCICKWMDVHLLWLTSSVSHL